MISLHREVSLLNYQMAHALRTPTGASGLSMAVVVLIGMVQGNCWNDSLNVLTASADHRRYEAYTALWSDEFGKFGI